MRNAIRYVQWSLFDIIVPLEAFTHEDNLYVFCYSIPQRQLQFHNGSYSLTQLMKRRVRRVCCREAGTLTIGKRARVCLFERGR